MIMQADFKNWLDAKIADELDDYENYSRDVYGSDLANTLFEGQNADGSVTCSSNEAKEFIKEHWDAAGDIHSSMKENFGEALYNPFDEPEAFQVVMLLEGAYEVLIESKFVQKHWDDSFELNTASIAIIKDDLGIESGFTDEQIDAIREKYQEDPTAAVEFAKSCNETTMKVLLVKPGEAPRGIEIEKGLKPLQKAVGGDIQAVYPFEDQVAIVCNEEGKISGMPLNRALYVEEGMTAPGMQTGDVYDILAGDFLVVGLSEDDFTSLSPELMEKYQEQFKHPETFARINGEIVAIKESVNDTPSLTSEAKDAREASQELSDSSMPTHNEPEL